MNIIIKILLAVCLFSVGWISVFTLMLIYSPHDFNLVMANYREWVKIFSIVSLMAVVCLIGAIVSDCSIRTLRRRTPH